ncbi:centromere protein I-like [Thrips palmi]|uniref:Centromere protein I-like n=1 Tax=Thrips palmi TaxID=161013 RepID=A0A6P8Y4C2_THRPL|nr:centromere protein I-like [Thrips palmi]
MSTVRRAITSIKNLNGKLSGNIYEHALTQLQSESGLSNDNIKTLLSTLTDDKLLKCRATSFRDVLFCCIPESSISGDVLEIGLFWMFANIKNEFVVSSKLNAVLDWVSGLLEFDLIDKTDIDGYYEMYYGMLQREQCQSSACKLIHMLTRPDDVYRGRVENIIKLYKKGGGRGKHLAYLIELFRTYKPELVPENVKSFSREAAFKKLLPGFKHMLESAHERLQSENNHLRSKNKGLDWTAVTFNKNRTAMPLIPTAMYVHLGSELYREKRRKVLEFLDKISLASFHLTCELPTSILSLMLNEGGMHFLVNHNSDVHARFSSVLYSCLHSVFIQNNKKVSYQEREHFLKQLVVLEDYMQQGIPVVSRFLAFYIVSWNGQDHQKYIYRLLERITLVNFAEFNDCILTHLYTLFLSGDINEKTIIVKTLSELLLNVYVKWLKKRPREHQFLGEKWEWETEFENVVPQLISVVTNFCELGLLITSSDPLMLHATLCFFEMLADLQLESKHKLTIIPPSIFYRCLFSLDFCSLVRGCDLLLRYKDTSEDLGPSGLENVSLLNKYACDVWNCLVTKKGFSKAHQGCILVKHKKLKELLPAHADSVFSLEYHPVMLGYAQHLQEVDGSSDAVLQGELIKDALMQSFPELGGCLAALENKYSEYHSGSS